MQWQNRIGSSVAAPAAPAPAPAPAAVVAAKPAAAQTEGTDTHTWEMIVKKMERGLSAGESIEAQAIMDRIFDLHPQLGFWLRPQPEQRFYEMGVLVVGSMRLAALAAIFAEKGIAPVRAAVSPANPAFVLLTIAMTRERPPAARPPTAGRAGAGAGPGAERQPRIAVNGVAQRLLLPQQDKETISAVMHRMINIDKDQARIDWEFEHGDEATAPGVCSLFAMGLDRLDLGFVHLLLRDIPAVREVEIVCPSHGTPAHVLVTLELSARPARSRTQTRGSETAGERAGVGAGSRERDRDQPDTRRNWNLG